MKKINLVHVSFLFLAAAVTMSNPSKAVPIYEDGSTTMVLGGRIQSVYHGKDAGGNPESGDASLNSTGRLHISVRAEIAEDIDGFSYAEWDVANGDNREQFDLRHAWVGIDFDSLGQVKAGKFENAYYYVLESNDIFNTFDDSAYFGNDDRNSGMFMYSWSGFGADVNLSYQTAKQNQMVEGAYGQRWDYATNSYYEAETADIEHGGAVSVGYTFPEDFFFGPVNVRLGYSYLMFSNHRDELGYHYNLLEYSNIEFPDGTVQDVSGRYDSGDQYGISMSWGIVDKGLYVATLFQQRRFNIVGVPKRDSNYIDDIDLTGSDIVGGYTFDNDVSLYAGVEYQRTEYGDFFSAEAMVLPVYLLWRVSSNFRVWAEGRFNLGTDRGDNENPSFKEFSGYDFSEDVFNLGMRFNF